MRVSACLSADTYSEFAITFCDIGNMSEHEIKSPAADLMNRVEISMASFSLQY
jgi:hypothetical protein